MFKQVSNQKLVLFYDVRDLELSILFLTTNPGAQNVNAMNYKNKYYKEEFTSSPEVVMNKE
tara:strand:- start:249 stop:431 length:183 start_codon:yes stop_codon:yes gene_type:complete